MQNRFASYFCSSQSNVVLRSFDEIESLKLEQTRLSQQCTDAQRHEKILMRRLANKEQEFQDYVSQIAEYKAAQAPSALALRSALLDPAVNLLFEKLKKELKATKAKLEETQNELSAWKFTPDSNTGKRLMAKCRLLYQENEELGKMTSNGRLAKLETELAMQKSFSEEVKKSQSELDDFLQELDEDVEGMQSTILFLQQELKTTRDRIQTLEKENYQLKSGATNCVADTCNKDAPGDIIKTIENDEQLKLSLTLNGSAITVDDDDEVDDTAKLYNNQVIAPIDVANELKLQNTATTINPSTAVDVAAAPLLETADEENTSFLRSATASIELYNGNEYQQSAAASDAEGNNSSLSVAGKLRTAASRKRNYEGDDTSEDATPLAAAAMPTNPVAVAVVMAPQQVASPRTLPPKKSKLRGVAIAEGGSADTVGLSIVDNAVAGMANEELSAGGMGSRTLIDDAPLVAVSVAQRIMTRRRSVRAQQNGGGSDA